MISYRTVCLKLLNFHRIRNSHYRISFLWNNMKILKRYDVQRTAMQTGGVLSLPLSAAMTDPVPSWIYESELTSYKRQYIHGEIMISWKWLWNKNVKATDFEQCMMVTYDVAMAMSAIIRHKQHFATIERLFSHQSRFFTCSFKRSTLSCRLRIIAASLSRCLSCFLIRDCS